MLGLYLHGVDSQDGGILIRVGVGSVAAGVAAFAVGFISYAWLTLDAGPANVGLRAGARDLSAFGTDHSRRLDLGTATLGPDIPDSPRVRLASLETGVDSESTFKKSDNQSEPVSSPFGERFSFDQPDPPSGSLQPWQRSESFDDRFTAAIPAPGATVRSAAAAPPAMVPRVAADLR